MPATVVVWEGRCELPTRVEYLFADARLDPNDRVLAGERFASFN
jgi:hypothetical protein